MSGSDKDARERTPFFDQLGTELVAAAHRDVAYRERVRKGALRLLAAGSLVAVTVVAFGVWSSPSAEAGIRVERSGGLVIVRLLDVEADPSGVERALQREGFQVSVRAIPAAPSKVGRFVQLSQTMPGVEDFAWVAPGEGSAAGFRIPEGFSGRLELVLGRSAWPWEDFAAVASAYAPGEPLHCTGVWGLKVSEALEQFSALDLEVRWQAFDGTAVNRIADADSISEMYVTDALSVGPGEILVTAAPTPRSPLNSSPPPPCHRG